MTPSIGNNTVIGDTEVSDTEEVFEEAVEELCDSSLASDALELAAEEVGETDYNRVHAVAELQRWVQASALNEGPHEGMRSNAAANTDFTFKTLI